LVKPNGKNQIKAIVINIEKYISTILGIQLPSEEQKLTLPPASAKNIQLYVKRDDQIHPIISGNKWRKVKFNLLEAKRDGVLHIVSFGGGFSNHLHALGYSCHQLGLTFTAIVRGDYSQNLSPMLKDIIRWKANIQYVTKAEYQTRDKQLLEQLSQQFPNALIIPEGGSSQYALKGVGEIIQELQRDYDYIVAPVASGGTLAGLIHSLASNSSTQVLGIGVLKGQGYLEELVMGLLPANNHKQNWQINHNYHFGGYAKKTTELEQFCNTFTQTHNLAIEPVYSGKLFYAINHLIQTGFFPDNSKILALHTGGLQGAR
jgi:1-aminocyclopropane-1-carboxylate deaminase